MSIRSRAVVGICAAIAYLPLAGAADHQLIRDSIAKAVPGAEPTSVDATAVPGLFEVVVGGHVLYMSEDGRYLIQGDLVDLQTRENITDVRRAAMRKALIDAVPESSMIVFAPKVVKHTVTVFTDIDCPYCRRLHKEVPAMNKLGIKIRYLAFPRAGVNSPSFKEAVSVWCSKDPAQALTDAKAGKKVPVATCDHPVLQHMALGEQVGVTGTPAMVLEDGRMVPGYMPATRLAQLLDGTLTDDKTSMAK
jgi:thiol:disulfide interchange protein DsbC